MNYKKRNKEIHRLKTKKGESLKQIADRYKVSRERIRQIVDRIENPPKKCRLHNSSYTGECKYCLIEEQYSKNSWLNLKDEIERVKHGGRKKGLILRKQMLIGRLIDKKGLSAKKVGYLLNNDHTTITHHYKKYGSRKKR